MDYSLTQFALAEQRIKYIDLHFSDVVVVMLCLLLSTTFFVGSARFHIRMLRLCVWDHRPDEFAGIADVSGNDAIDERLIHRKYRSIC